MTTRFRLDAMALNTTRGPVRYRFASDLTVLAGKTGVGKTTLLELVKFGFGGNGLVAPVARTDVLDVTLDVTIGTARLRLTRSLDEIKRRTVQVTDLVTQERLPDQRVDSSSPRLSTLLLEALGLPTDARAAARGQSRKPGDIISFADIYTYLYVPQEEINRDIAHSKDSYLASKRRTVFELLFGLTDPEILRLGSEINLLTDAIDKASTEHRNVLAFLRDSRTTGRAEAEAAVASAIEAEVAAKAELAALRDAVDPVSDRQTLALRDLLSEAERSVADVRRETIELVRQQAEYIGERRRVQQDLDRLARMRDAGDRLASIEFGVCPRCMQGLTQRPIPPGACRLCLQPDPVETVDGIDPYEVVHLRSQLDDMDEQIAVIAKNIEVNQGVAADKQLLIQDLTVKIDARTATRVTPRLQAYSDAAEKLATARVQQRQLELVLRQWDRVNDLSGAVDELRAQQTRLRATQLRAEEALADRRTTILDDLDAEFNTTVLTIGVPGVRKASINRSSYIPMLDGKPFSEVSRGGGIVTATQVAYWVSLLTVAIRQRDTKYPAFLLIDSPRLALNNAEALSRALYSRLVTQVDVMRGRLQVIIADNEIPPEYRRDYAEIDFSYENPTISTVAHPGPAAVSPIMQITE